MASSRTSAVHTSALSLLLIATSAFIIPFAAAGSKGPSLPQGSSANTTITCSKADYEKKLCGQPVPDEGRHPLACGSRTTLVLGYLPYNWDRYLSICTPAVQTPASSYFGAVAIIDTSYTLYQLSGVQSFPACTTCSKQHYMYQCSVYISTGGAMVLQVTSC